MVDGRIGVSIATVVLLVDRAHKLEVGNATTLRHLVEAYRALENPPRFKIVKSNHVLSMVDGRIGVTMVTVVLHAERALKLEVGNATTRIHLVEAYRALENPYKPKTARETFVVIHFLNSILERSNWKPHAK